MVSELARQTPASLALFHALGGVGSSLVATAIVVILVWCRDVLRYRIAWLGRALRCAATRSSYVLVWNDDSKAQSHKLIKHLKPELGRGIIFKALPEPDALRFYPLGPRRTRAVVLLDTDVTKLSPNPKHAEHIEKRLDKYVEGGGGLIAGHDVIWRRVRSHKLQKIAGGTLKRFESFRDDPVQYKIKDGQDEHPLRTGLDDTFALADGEVCFGEWTKDAVTVYATGDNQAHPLVVAREYAKGRAVWLNSGDMTDSGLCQSIAKPDDNFIRLLVNAINWVSAKS